VNFFDIEYVDIIQISSQFKNVQKLMSQAHLGKAWKTILQNTLKLLDKQDKLIEKQQKTVKETKSNHELGKD